MNLHKVAKEELSRECDYELEAKNQKIFRDLLRGEIGYYVPAVIDELSGKRVLTSELVPGNCNIDSRLLFLLVDDEIPGFEIQLSPT